MEIRGVQFVPRAAFRRTIDFLIFSPACYPEELASLDASRQDSMTFYLQ
jgi:hypothetical protein